MKKFLFLLTFVFLSSCQSDDFYPFCPNVIIPRSTAYLTQNVNHIDNFQIQLTGFEGYCYFDKRVKRQKAVVTPVFEIIKLRNTDENELNFTYFTETRKGPPAYLGKWVHSVDASIPMDKKQIEFKGKPVELKVPDGDAAYGFEIVLGLRLSSEEKKYNNRTFDINYRFEENN